MCRCLRIQPSGFYAWLQAPMSARAQEDRRQTELLRKAWAESGKVYGYRKLHDDLVEQGESICPNRVARLAQIAGIKVSNGAQTGPLLGRDRRRTGTPFPRRDEGRATIGMRGICGACGGGRA